MMCTFIFQYLKNYLLKLTVASVQAEKAVEKLEINLFKNLFLLRI